MGTKRRHGMRKTVRSEDHCRINYAGADYY
jgi:hypothetical protein